MRHTFCLVSVNPLQCAVFPACVWNALKIDHSSSSSRQIPRISRCFLTSSALLSVWPQERRYFLHEVMINMMSCQVVEGKDTYTAKQQELIRKAKECMQFRGSLHSHNVLFLFFIQQVATVCVHAAEIIQELTTKTGRDQHYDQHVTNERLSPQMYHGRRRKHVSFIVTTWDWIGLDFEGWCVVKLLPTSFMWKKCWQNNPVFV